MTARRTSSKRSTAYRAGYRDGLAWDLDGFDSRAEACAATGWDEATINALGAREFAKHLGISPSSLLGGTQFERAMKSYNEGARKGVCAMQSRRSGLPPRAGED